MLVSSAQGDTRFLPAGRRLGRRRKKSISPIEPDQSEGVRVPAKTESVYGAPRAGADDVSCCRTNFIKFLRPLNKTSSDYEVTQFRNYDIILSVSLGAHGLLHIWDPPSFSIFSNLYPKSGANQQTIAKTNEQKKVRNTEGTRMFSLCDACCAEGQRKLAKNGILYTKILYVRFSTPWLITTLIYIMFIIYQILTRVNEQIEKGRVK